VANICTIKIVQDCSLNENQS